MRSFSSLFWVLNYTPLGWLLTAAREWLNSWANEILQVSRIGRVTVLVELATIVAMDQQAQRTLRWWIPRWRPIRRKFIPSTYSLRACWRIPFGYPLGLGSGVYLQPQCMQRYL